MAVLLARDARRPRADGADGRGRRRDRPPRPDVQPARRGAEPADGLRARLPLRAVGARQRARPRGAVDVPLRRRSRGRPRPSWPDRASSLPARRSTASPATTTSAACRHGTRSTCSAWARWCQARRTSRSARPRSSAPRSTPATAPSRSSRPATGPYVSSASLNGAPLDRAWIRDSEMTGTLAARALGHGERGLGRREPPAHGTDLSAFGCG